MWLVYKWRGAFWLGMTIFGLGFVGQTIAVLLRWYVADRFPNTNMFEAVTTSAWFAAIFALIMEVVVRRTRMSGILAAAAICSMVAMMATRLYPLELSEHLQQDAGAPRHLALHTHQCDHLLLRVDLPRGHIRGLYMLWRLVSRDGKGTDAWARAGGAGFLIVPRAGGQAGLVSTRTGFGHVLDGTTMILVELSFILLWAGLVMGAIWADHSWGRPWGWDPKEVFALNTFIIYAMLIHVRLKVKDKGMWTAVLAIAGCAVMLFNWIIINFTISGLHSYA